MQRPVLPLLILGAVSFVASCSPAPAPEEARQHLEQWIAEQPSVSCSELRLLQVQETGDTTLRYVFEGSCLDPRDRDAVESIQHFGVGFDRTFGGWEVGEIERLRGPGVSNRDRPAIASFHG